MHHSIHTATFSKVLIAGNTVYKRITWIVQVMLVYILTYLLTPWSKVLLEKLSSSQLVKKFLAFYGT